MKQIAAAVVAVLGALAVVTAEANVPEWEVPTPVQTDCEASGCTYAPASWLVCMSSECYAPLVQMAYHGGEEYEPVPVQTPCNTESGC